jgi:hypothetical protein
MGGTASKVDTEQLPAEAPRPAAAAAAEQAELKVEVGGADEGAPKSPKEKKSPKSPKASRKKEGEGGEGEGCDGCVSPRTPRGCPLAGTMKPYDHHVIVCGFNTEWSEKIEQMEDTQTFSLSAALKRASERHSGKELRINLTATEYRCPSPHTGDAGFCQLVVYPAGITIEFPFEESNVDMVMDYLYTNIPTSIVAAWILKPMGLPWERLVLVCVHMARDKRCGRIGPQILSAMSTYLSEHNISEQQVKLLPTSHIGGHKYAGVLIVYPEGDWYGQITGRNAGTLLETVLEGKRLDKNWRGNYKEPAIEKEIF